MKPSDETKASSDAERLNEAKRFIAALTGSDDTSMTFQLFRDQKPKNPDEKERFKKEARVIDGTIEDKFAELDAHNRNGLGIFVTVNETDGKGRSAKNIRRVRAVFADIEDLEGRELPIKPSISVLSGRGEHFYFIVDDVPLSEFKPLQQRIARKLRSDITISDLSRVMRVPGFFHCKNPDDRKLVRITQIQPAIFSKVQIENAFPKITSESKTKAKTRQKTKSSKTLLGWTNDLPIEEGQPNRFGGRNKTVLILARKCLAEGLTENEIVGHIERYCDRSGLSLVEAMDVFSRQKAQHESEPFTATISTESKPFELAKLFVLSRYTAGGFILVRLYRGDLYRYEAGVYRLFDHEEMKLQLIQFLQGSDDRVRNVRVLNEIITHVHGLIALDSSQERNAFLGSPAAGSHFISFDNGFIEIRPTFGEGDLQIQLSEHTPALFNHGRLPYSFESISEDKPPIFSKFLDEMIPDVEVQEFLQEWLGYNLIPITKFAKAVVLVGEGANGKSVLTTVLSALVGRENVCSIGLEAFDPKRTFALAWSRFKLANIVEDLSSSGKTSEGMIRSFISGGEMSVEEKNKSFFQLTPTARCTFATNDMPRFADTSDGLHRRMIVIPMTTQILEESKQDKRLLDLKFWELSGELPLIFSLALRGLHRLLKRDRFIEPEVSSTFKRGYRFSTNPVREFLELACEECDVRLGEQISALEVYGEYKAFAEQSGYRLLPSSSFTGEVKRIFKHARTAENPRMSSQGKRSRHWIGLRKIGTHNTTKNLRGLEFETSNKRVDGTSRTENGEQKARVVRAESSLDSDPSPGLANLL